jgi:hypothetical protein
MATEQHARHCPFLNRSDDRCSTHFSLDSLNAAFEHCFDAYAACPVYQELLIERQIRRSAAGDGTSHRPAGGVDRSAVVQLTVGSAARSRLRANSYNA